MNSSRFIGDALPAKIPMMGRVSIEQIKRGKKLSFENSDANF